MSSRYATFNAWCNVSHFLFATNFSWRACSLQVNAFIILLCGLVALSVESTFLGALTPLFHRQPRHSVLTGTNACNIWGLYIPLLIVSSCVCMRLSLRTCGFMCMCMRIFSGYARCTREEEREAPAAPVAANARATILLFYCSFTMIS